jgi:hypothetical protein
MWLLGDEFTKRLERRLLGNWNGRQREPREELL